MGFRAALLLPLALLLPALAAAAQHKALLITIDDGAYKFVTEKNPLVGASEDAHRIKTLLDSTGFDVTSLSEQSATKALISDWLGQQQTGCTKGDEVVFYFSGRGGLVDKNAPTDKNSPAPSVACAPTLLPADAKPEDSSNDVLLSDLEQFSTTLENNGVHVTIILDCCWPNNLQGKGKEGLPYKITPKCFRRGGGFCQTSLFNGKGTFLSAADYNGSAYEWETTIGVWASAFTTVLCGEFANFDWRGEQPPKNRELFSEVLTYFQDMSDDGYMPNAAPYSNLTAKSEGGQGAGDVAFLSLTQLPPIKGDLEDMVKKEQADEQVLKIAISTNPDASDADLQKLGPQREIFYNRIGQDFGLFARVVEAKLQADMVVTLQFQNGKMVASLKGTLQDKPDTVFTGADCNEILNAGLEARIQRTAYAFRLYHLPDLQTPTLQSKAVEVWLNNQESNRYGIMDYFEIQIGAGIKSCAYVLENEGGKLLRVDYPSKGQQNNAVPEEGRAIFSGQIPQGNTIGRTPIRVIVFDNGEALPPLKGGSTDPKTFNQSLCDQMKLLLDGIKNKTIHWAEKSTYYIVEQS